MKLGSVSVFTPKNIRMLRQQTVVRNVTPPASHFFHNEQKYNRKKKQPRKKMVQIRGFLYFVSF